MLLVSISQVPTVKWTVDEVLLRASFGIGYKARTLVQLFLGQSFSVTTAVDKTRCDESQAIAGAPALGDDQACRPLEIHSVSGGIPTLQTATSQNISAGLVYEITYGWTLAVDCYHIEVEDKLDSLAVQKIISDESQFPDLPTRVNWSLSVLGAEERSDL